MKEQLREVSKIPLNTASAYLLSMGLRNLFPPSAGLSCYEKAYVLRELYRISGIKSSIMPALGRHGGGHAAVLIEHDGQLFFADPSIYHDEPLLVRGASWQFVSSRGEAYPIVTDARGEKHSSVLSITPTGEGSFKAEMSIFDGDNYHLRFYHKYDIENTMEEFPDIGDVPALYLADPALMLKYLVGEEVRIVLMSFGEDGEKVLQFKDLSDAGGYTTVRKGDEGYAYDARLSRVASESGIGALDIENMLGHVRTCVTALRNRV